MMMPELAQTLMQCERVAIIAHVLPDGDALGSALAARNALLKLHKQAVVVCEHTPAMMYAFMPGIETVITPENLPFEPDCALLVDVASPDRAGTAMPISTNAPVRLMIDHHTTNHGFSGLGVVEPKASSTGEMILRLLDEMQVPLDDELAILLYTAISTDTGNFSFSNTTPEAMRAVARCLEAGLDIDEYNRRLFRCRSVARTRMLGIGLSRMELTLNGRIAYIRLTRDMFLANDAKHEDTEGLVNYLAEMEGVEACFLAEQRWEETKISIRSSGKVDVGQLAQSMGGGGHERAAGMTLAMPLDGATYKVLDALTRALNGDDQ